MRRYNVKYVIQTSFEAESDEEANKIKEKNLNAIFKSDDFNVWRFKMETTIYELGERQEIEG